MKQNFYSLFLGRMVEGFAFGFIGNSVPVYLGSIASLENKGMIGGLYSFFLVLGLFIGQVLSFVFEKRVMIPYYIYIAFLMIHFLLLFLIEDTKNTFSKTKSIFELFSRKEARKSIFLAIFLHVTQQLSCINGFIFFSNTVQPDKSIARRNTMIRGLLLLFCNTLTMFIVEKLGRKKLLLFSTLVGIIALFGVAMTSYVFTFLLIFYVGFSVGLGPIVWLMPAELFPEEYVNAGSELAVNFNWSLTFAVPYLFGLMFEKVKQKAFYPFAFYLIGAFFVILLFLKETKGRTPQFQ